MTASEPLEQAEQADQWAWLARIRRPQGRKGEVFADILTDFPEKFAERRRLWLLSDPEFLHLKSNPAPVKGAGISPYIAQRKAALAPEERSSGLPREVVLLTHWLHKGGIVLHFDGSGSISDAEALAGLIVAIPLALRASLDDDEVYIADLIGCTLFDAAKSDGSGSTPIAVGEIEDVDRSAGPVALLVVRSPGSPEGILIPFAKSYIRSIDLAAKRIEMALPEGLVDLNTRENPESLGDSPTCLGT